MVIFNHVTCILLFIFYFSTVYGQNFIPTFYKISLDFSNSTNTKTFVGVATIDFNVTQKVYGYQKLILDAESLEIGDIIITDSNNRQIDIVRSGYEKNKHNKYSIMFKLDLDASELIVGINYKGFVVSAGGTGVFMTDEKNIIATNSYPEGVRKIFPCINDPSIRTSFQLNVKLVSDQWGIHHVTDGEESPVLAAHAVGFIMTHRYRKVDDVSTDKFYVWVPSNNQPLYDSVNNNKILKDVLAKGTYFNSFFKEASLDKIHIVMVPGIKPLSIINHRLISIRPDVLISSDEDTSEMNKATAVAVLNALAKHFFRCVVSPQTWEDFWLSDSLALYLQYALLNNDIFHDFNFPDLFTLELQRPAMRGSSIAVQPKSIDPSILITDNVFPPAYQGASLLKMLEPLSSRTEIIQDLLNYYNKFVYTSVNTNGFLEFMTKGSMFKALNAYGKNLQSIMDKWIHDTGYPYLTDITISQDGFTLLQERYDGINSGSEWIIPFVYTDNSNRNGTLGWVTGNRNNLYMESNIGAWIQLNKHSKGMFRVNYGSMIDELSKKDVYSSLSSNDRAALIDDSYLMAWTKNPKLNFGSVLNLFGSLANEMEYTPFALTMNHINTLRHLYSQKGLEYQYEVKIGEIIYSTYGNVDWNKPKSVNIGKAMWTRAVVEATCDYSAATCDFDAGTHSSGYSSVLNDLLPTINCHLVRASPQVKWLDKFKKFYDKTNTQYARADALYALACPRNHGEKGSVAIKTYLDTINSDNILTEDAQRAFSYIYSRLEHINQTIIYIQNNYLSLMTRFGDDFMAALITDISKLFLPDYYMNIMENIKSNSQVNSNTAKAITAAQAEMIERNSIVNTYLYQIANWLHTNATTYKPLPQTTPSSNGPSPNSAVNLSSSILTLMLFISLIFYMKM